MRPSLRLLVLGVAVPGALSPLVYRRVVSERPPEVRVHHTVRVHAMRAPAPPVAPVPTVAPAAPRPPAPPAPPRRMAVVMHDVEACRFSHDERLDVAAETGARLDLDAGSGSLRLEGVDGLERVEVEARECASEEAWLDDLGVELERAGGEVTLRTRYPEQGRGRGDRYARIDLVVRVPLGMPALVRDGSGEAWISGTGALEMEDGSGELEIRGVNGPVRVRDGSGELLLVDIGGDVEIEDGSGELDVADVQGSVVLEDGSGSVEVGDVEGDVRVRSDASGSIRVREVEGDFVVERDGSGDVRWSGVAGQVDVPRRGGRG